MARVLIIDKNKVLRLDRPKQSAKKTLSQRLKEFSDTLTARNFVWENAGMTGSDSIRFTIGEVKMAGKETKSDNPGHLYDYTFKGFSCIVTLSIPQKCKITSSPGYMSDGGFYKTEDLFEKVYDLYGDYLHPHFNGTGTMCLALGWEDEFKACLENDNWNGLIDSVIASISQYNADNPFRHLPHEYPHSWSRSLLDDDFEDEEYAECGQCGSRQYYEDRWTCVRCENEICEYCSRSCYDCGEPLCDRCYEYSEEDEHDRCSECHQEYVSSLVAECHLCFAEVDPSDIILCTCWNEVCEDCVVYCASCNERICKDCSEEYDLENEDGTVETEIRCRRCAR